MELRNASLFDGSAFRAGRYDIRVEENRITDVSPHVAGAAMPEGAIDLDGRTVMPGLIHGHMHADLFAYSAADFMGGQTLGKERPPGVLMAIALRTCGVGGRGACRRVGAGEMLRLSPVAI